MNTILSHKIKGHINNLCKPDMIMVFGSFARGQENRNSDLDLIVVCKSLFKRKMLERQIKTRLKKYGLKSDVLLRTNEEIAIELKNPNSFLTSVLKNGKIIQKKTNFSWSIN